MANHQPEITWTPAKLQRFKVHYKTACDNTQESFRFEGHIFMCEYAKYLIEYLEGQFREMRDRH